MTSNPIPNTVLIPIWNLLRIILISHLLIFKFPPKRPIKLCLQP
jgi:hypothetical protein